MDSLTRILCFGIGRGPMAGWHAVGLRWWDNGLHDEGHAHVFASFGLRLGLLMRNVQPRTTPAAAGNHWVPALVSLAVGGAFFALWFWLLPRWLCFRVETAGASRWRWLAAVPSVLGFAVALRCVWDFGWTGHGTPAPVVPPKRLVVVGFYRYVRNPMYLGFAVGWIGLWVVFGHANPVAITAVAAAALAVHLFVVSYEEPTLRKKFGAEYQEYCQNVGRWWPRLKGWDKPQ